MGLLESIHLVGRSLHYPPHLGYRLPPKISFNRKGVKLSPLVIINSRFSSKKITPTTISRFYLFILFFTRLLYLAPGIREEFQVSLSLVETLVTNDFS